MGSALDPIIGRSSLELNYLMAAVPLFRKAVGVMAENGWFCDSRLLNAGIDKRTLEFRHYQAITRIIGVLIQHVGVATMPVASFKVSLQIAKSRRHIGNFPK